MLRAGSKTSRSLIDTKPVFRWGIVTNEDPLLVQLDGDDRPIAGSPSTIIGGLAAGERVLCLIQNRRVTVLGRGGDEGSTMSATRSRKFSTVAQIYWNANQTVNLSEPVSAQANGIMLAWSAWSNSSATDSGWNFTAVPKGHVSVYSGAGVAFQLSRGYSSFTGTKYAYVSNTRIAGHANNVSGNSNSFVLREVYGY